LSPRSADIGIGLDPDLYAHMCITRWKDIAADSRKFVAEMKTQQRYLTGEDYYDACGVKEGEWYNLQGRLVQQLDPGVVLQFNPLICLTGGPRGRSDIYWTLCGLGPSGPSSQQWQFKKIRSGWWLIHNKAQGNGLALDGGRGGGSFSPGDTSSGQYWRVLTGGDGRCRLVNSFEGAGYSLEAHSGRDQRVTLEPTNKENIDQLWKWQ
jgi:hypothetical protein